MVLHTHTEQWRNLHNVCTGKKFFFFLITVTLLRHEWETPPFLFFHLIKAKPEAIQLKHFCISCDSSVNCIDLLRAHIDIHARDSDGISWGQNIWLPPHVVLIVHSSSLEYFWNYSVPRHPLNQSIHLNCEFSCILPISERFSSLSLTAERLCLHCE